MSAYEKFAQVYDLFMDNIDYPAWCTYLTGILKEYGIEDGLIAELGCGTGSMRLQMFWFWNLDVEPGQ